MVAIVLAQQPRGCMQEFLCMQSALGYARIAVMAMTACAAQACCVCFIGHGLYRSNA
jgi:hypothetical protein